MSIAGSCGDVVVRATPVCEGAACPSPLEAPPGEFALSADFAWSLAAHAKECWSESIVVPAGASRLPAATIRTWPAATLRGRFVVARGEQKPRAATLRIESKTIGRTDVACDVSADRWTCVVPATRLDARLAVDGFAPHYAWDVNAPAQLGDVTLARGASLSGRVAFDGNAESVSIEITPEVFGDVVPSAEKRLAQRSVTTSPNARGFFHVRNLAPGTYRLLARSKGWSTLRLYDVRVEDQRETMLDPLQLQPLSAVEVRVDPPLAHDGHPWTVELWAREGRTKASAIAAKAVVDEQGIARMMDVESGDYGLNVATKAGARFASAFVTVVPLMAPIDLRVKSVEVRGIVKHDGEPLAAELSFQNSDIGSPVDTRTDAAGVYRTVLAGEGTFRVKVKPHGSGGVWVDAEVRREEGKPFAWAELELPGGHFDGVVLGPDGHRVRALVRLIRPKQLQGTAWTDDDGRFSFMGIEPGDVELVASADGKGRATLPYRVHDGDSPDVTIRLERPRALRGRVRNTAGHPIAGAAIQYAQLTDMKDDVSGPSGEFSIPLYAPRGAIDLLVLASGYPVKFVSVAYGADVPDVDVVLGTPAGLLDIRMPSVPPFRFLRPAGASTSFIVPFTVAPYRPRGNPSRDPASVGPIYEVEAGVYTICPTYEVTAQCITRVVEAGTRVDIETKEWKR